MPPLLDMLILAVLVVIAAELVLLRRDLSRIPLIGPERDKGEGQTINVNLGGVPLAPIPAANDAAPPTPKQEAEAEPSAEVVAEEERELQGEPEEAPERIPAYTPAARPTSSGLIALACPNCKAENSSYRSECFNCGASLR